MNPVLAKSETVTGNCHACIKFHDALRPRLNPPCHRCPKFLLYPQFQSTVGLHPANEMAVHLYRSAAVDIRSEGVLIGTLTPEGAGRALDEYADCFETAQERRQTFQLMWLLNQVVTTTRQPLEAKARERAMAKAEADAKNKAGRGR